MCAECVRGEAAPRHTNWRRRHNGSFSTDQKKKEKNPARWLIWFTIIPLLKLWLSARVKERRHMKSRGIWVQERLVWEGTNELECNPIPDTLVRWAVRGWEPERNWQRSRRSPKTLQRRGHAVSPALWEELLKILLLTWLDEIRNQRSAEPSWRSARL